MAVLRTPDGKLILVGGRFLSATPSGSPSVPGTTLVVTEYPVGNTLAKPVFQRKAGTEAQSDGGYADVPVLFSYTGGAPANAQARVVAADGGAVIRDWASLTSVQVNDSARTGLGILPSVPVGCEYLLQIRDGSQSSSVSAGTRRWGVGVCILVAGQSNMVSTLTAGAYNGAVPGSTLGENGYWNDPKFSGSYFGVDGFVTPYTVSGNSGSSNISGLDSGAGGAIGFVRMLGAALTAKYGRKVPICAAIWAWGSTGLADMMLPGGGKAQIYSNSGTGVSAIGWLSPKGYTPGDFEGVVLHQGETGSMVRSERLALLKSYYTFLLSVVAPYGRDANTLFFRPAVLGSYGATSCDSIENIRAAAYDLEAAAPGLGWPRVKAGWTCIDLDPSDNGDQGLHFRDVSGGNQYQKWSLRRMIQDVQKELGIASFSGAGPRIAGVTLAGNVATVTVAHGGGTALVPRNSGAALSGWYANVAVDFNGADIPVTAAISGAGTVAVTFPAGTTFPAYLKYMGGKVGMPQSRHPDLTNPVYDNVQYPTGATGSDLFTGLPLQPTPDAIKVG